MTASEDQVLEGARLLRGVLPELYGSPEDWESIDDELSEVLNGADVEAAARVLAIVELRPETAAWWLARQRSIDQPGAGSEERRGITYPPSRGEVVAAPRFACPQGDTVWYRRSTSVPVPNCRTHGLRLTPTRKAPA
jgi:hypothetical protein